MTKIIGLTGGIGSGKTTIANLFREANIPVYIADDEARKIMQSPEIIEEIKNTFGSEIFDDTILNREKLSQIVFNEPEKLKLLNAIIHPAVRKHFQNWVLNHEKYPFVIYEAAILFESGSYKNCDLIITVTAPIETRIERVIQRDKTTREQVLKRINAQWDDTQRISKSDFVIVNIDPKTTKLEIGKILKILNI
ncbi:dephospho-CoA kinase [Flavobacterium alvei]|uniref:Dephospho-CoA kinase n=1 Tax=Flavobacterium alvei TaxID=2080416 RepID=A0A2S5A800_9FLAO|nr:dephospho-CoA kinase [Flavobacterium alvei]POY38731.1 dephospho-CoA kinase [Flavobacterium alvei]HQE34315.1 dephospho-CoA kinase [Flavobacterium alvei]HQF48166.1 dephospho-CoA kinase [Flavobacterium alvei]HQK40218.1 dephospho-CoA kinase [Flavobacterium alvei]